MGQPLARTSHEKGCASYCQERLDQTMINITAPRVLKALISRENNPLHPDPQVPKLITRQPDTLQGLGQLLPHSFSQGSSKSSGKSSGTFAAKSKTYSNYYSTTSKNGSLHVCAHARARMCVYLYLSGSRVVVRSKPLIRKGKCHYFAHYFATTLPAASGSGLSKPLKSFEKGDF